MMLLKMTSPETCEKREREKEERKGDRKRKEEEEGGINCSQLGCHDNKPKFLSVRPLGQGYKNQTRVQNLPKSLD